MAAGGRELGSMAEGEGIRAQCAVETSHCEARKFATSEFHFLNLERKTAFGGKPGLGLGSPTY